MPNLKSNEQNLIPLYDPIQLASAIKASKTLSEALRRLGIDPTSTRIEIASRLVKKEGIDTTHLIHQGIRYTKENLEEAVKQSKNWADVARHFGLQPGSGGSHTHLKHRTEGFGVDTSHFTGSGWFKGKISNKRKTSDEILVTQLKGSIKTPTYILRRALLDIGVGGNCDICKQEALWNGKPLVLQIDHIDGNPRNHQKENLRFLCPNCHTQTPNYGNKRNRTKVGVKP